jgi:hypothetical protein
VVSGAAAAADGILVAGAVRGVLVLAEENLGAIVADGALWQWGTERSAGTLGTR